MANYTAYYKYRLTEPLAYKLQFDYGLEQDVIEEYYTITTDNWLLLHRHYAWNGADCFPDFDWIKIPSAIHDALLQAIADGHLPESSRMNDQIDKELAVAIGSRSTSGWLKRMGYAFRGTYVNRATNLANTHKGDTIPSKRLPPLEHECTLEEFFRRTGR